MTVSREPAIAFKSASSLRIWIPLSVALFVLLGSLSLIYIFERHRASEELAAFEDMARVNAGFIERTRLSQSPRLATRLSEIIGVQVFFWHSHINRVIGAEGTDLDSSALDMDFNGKVQMLPDGRMMVGIKGSQGIHVVFLRDRVARGLAMVSRDAWFALAIFWLLSLALGLGLSKWVTKPLLSLVKSLPMVGTQGELHGLPLARRDEIGRLAQVLKQTHETLNQERELRRRAERHAILGRMAASLAHEIRNPISAIRLHTELLDAGSPEEFADSKRLILDESARLESLVGQWMSYARPEPPQMAEMDLVAAMRRAIQLIRPQASHMGVDLVVDPSAASSLPVIADRQRMQQVLGNLLLNAVQAMPSGGQVVVQMVDQGERVSLELSDRGSGFSDHALEHFGEPFFSEKEGGMGLGLAVAKGICEAHGGVLSAVNRDSGGACVRVQLFKTPPQTDSKS